MSHGYMLKLQEVAVSNKVCFLAICLKPNITRPVKKWSKVSISATQAVPRNWTISDGSMMRAFGKRRTRIMCLHGPAG